LGLTLDESKEDDEVFDRNGLAFAVNKDLLKEAQPITVDYVSTPSGEGFTVTSGIVSKSDGCGGCSC